MLPLTKTSKMKNTAKEITGYHERLTVKYTQSQGTCSKAFFISIYWDGQYTHRYDTVFLKTIENNQASTPTTEDIDNYLYQTAVERLYNVRNKYNNPVYIMN